MTLGHGFRAWIVRRANSALTSLRSTAPSPLSSFASDRDLRVVLFGRPELTAGELAEHAIDERRAVAGELVVQRPLWLRG